jgi:hypothetical protein
VFAVTLGAGGGGGGCLLYGSQFVFFNGTLVVVHSASAIRSVVLNLPTSYYDL